MCKNSGSSQKSDASVKKTEKDKDEAADIPDVEEYEKVATIDYPIEPKVEEMED